MGRIHVLPEHVANKIAAGEVVERPASVVKELLENALDAGSTRIKIVIEAGGKKLIQITDNGCGMVRDDALLAFERHATSKIKNAEDLLNISTLGFRGEALPSIASVCRFRLETRASDQDSGTIVELTGGKIFRVEEAGLPTGTSITIRDLFFNTPARKKFLKAESTELSHIASLITHYALAHPDKHFELHSATNAVLVAPPVASYNDRVYQVFGKDVLDQLISVAAEVPLARIGLPQPPPWRRKEKEEDDDSAPSADPGSLRRTCKAPCTSISRTRSSPCCVAASSHFFGVPYQFFPNTCAYSRNWPVSTICWNSLSETKLYHLPSLSVLRGARVVHETDNMVPGNSRIFSTSVDFPEPDGPETIITSGPDSLIRCSAPAPAIFRFPILFPGPAA